MFAPIDVYKRQAVGLDDRLLGSQEGGAAVLLAVHLVLQVRHAALEQQVGDLAAEVCQEHLLCLLYTSRCV